MLLLPKPNNTWDSELKLRPAVWQSYELYILYPPQPPSRESFSVHTCSASFIQKYVASEHNRCMVTFATYECNFFKDRDLNCDIN